MADVTVSGTPVTDALRALGVQGDGRTSDSSFGVWEATTNLENSAGADVSFESGTTGYLTFAANTIASSAEQAKFGTKSCKVTHGGGVDPLRVILLQINLTLTAAAHSASRWIYVPASYDGGGIRVDFANYAGATGTIFADANMALRDQWQRVTVPNVGIVGGDLIGNVRVITTGADPTAGRFIYVDGSQTETQPLCTPFTISPRAAARVQAPASLLDETQGWVAMRVRMGYSSADSLNAGNGDPRFFWWGINDSRICVQPIANTLQAISDTGPNDTVNQALTWAKDDVITVICAWTAAQIKVSGNGAVFATAARTAVPVIADTLPAIGARSDGLTTGQLDGDVLWFACGTGTLTDTDAATIHALGNIPNSNTYTENLPGTATAIWHANTSYYHDTTFTPAFDTRYPRLKLQWAPTTQPTSTTQTWETITSRLRGWDWGYGRNDELARFEAGTGTVLLNNRDRALDPSFNAGAWYGNIKPRRMFRLLGLWAEVEYPIFQAHARGFPQAYPAAGKDAVVKVDLVDAFAILQGVDLVIGFSRSAELTGARITAILDAIGVPAALRDIDAGTVTVDAFTVTTTGTSGLDHAKQVAIDSEGGQLFVAKDGKVTFHDYNQRLNATNQRTFTDTAAATLGYGLDFEPAFDETYLWNYIRVTGADGDATAQITQDTASQADYFKLTKPVSTELVSGSEIKQVADRFALRYAQPELRAPALSMQGAGSPAARWPVILGLNVSDRVTVNRYASSADPMSLVQNVEGLRHGCRPGGPWTTSVVTSPADTRTYMVADHATLQIADAGNLAA